VREQRDESYANAPGHSLIDDSSISDYGGLGITVCPERHNPAVFIAWIEENISPRPEQRYPSGCLVDTLDQVDKRQELIIFEMSFRRSESSI
jgi:hypothetical protein